MIFLAIGLDKSKQFYEGLKLGHIVLDMLSQAVLKFAKENGFKFSEGVVFGLYKGQLLAIAEFGSEACTVTCTLKTSLKTHKADLRNSEILRKVKLHRGFKLINDRAIKWNIHLAFIKDKEEYFHSLLDAIVEEIGRYQTCGGNGDVLLHGNVAKFKTDVESVSLPKSQMETDPFTGFFAALGASVVLGALLGFLQHLMVTKANLHMNSFFIGILIGTSAVAAYKKMAGRIDRFGKCLIIPFVAIGYLIYLVSNLYYHLKGGYDISFQMLKAEFARSLLEHLSYHALALFSGAILTVTSIFQKNSFHAIHGGSEISDDVLDIAKNHRTGDRIAGIVLILITVCSLGAIWMALSVGNVSSVATPWPFIFCASILHVGLVVLGYRLAAKYRPVELVLTHSGATHIGSIGKFVALNSLAFFVSLSAVFSLMTINTKLDNSLAMEYTTTVINEVVTEKGANYCYDIKHWNKEEPFSDLSLCYNDYGSLRRDEEIKIFVKDGFLGVPWIAKIELPRFSTFEVYLKSFENEEDLRSKEVQMFFKRLEDTSSEEREFIRSKISEWTSQCERKKDYSCRLRAYFSEYKNQIDDRNRYLDKGCDGGDETACYGLYLGEKTTQEQKNKYLTLLKKKCEEKDWDSCLKWGGQMWKTSYHENYDTLLDLYTRTCEEGKEEAACQSIETLRAYPVKKTM